MPEQLQEAIQRVVSGSRNEADIQAIAAALQAGQLTLVTGNGAIGVGGDAPNAISVSGSNNIIVQGQVAESLQLILERFSPNQLMTIAPVDDLVQRVRSRFHGDIQRLHGTMPLWGVDHWVPLSDLFVDVNVLEELSSSGKSELNDLWQTFTAGTESYSSYRSLDRIGVGKEQERVFGLDVLANNTNLMVVGKPGSGKTTYLQSVAIECNAGNIQQYRVPVLIKLRDFVDDGCSVKYCLKQYFSRCWRLSEGEIEALLRQGRALVLLDGLDEVTGETGKAIAKQIKQFAREFPQNQLVVTCRTQIPEAQFDWKSLRFQFVEVADFNEKQVRLFTENWFKAIGDSSPDSPQNFLSQLFSEENKPIRELAITPILLSLTCAVFYQTGTFYSKRSKLYEEGLELLLDQWDKSREIERDEIYRNLTVERKIELLSYLAIKKFEQPQYVLFEQAELEEYIAEFLEIGKRESRAVLKAIEVQHGLLIERSQKVWSFSHLTFQEYFTAKQITSKCNPLSIDDPVLNKLVEHTNDKHWREVFLLSVDLICKPDYLFKIIKNKIDCIVAYDDEIQQFLVCLSQKVESIEAIWRGSASRAFYFGLTFAQPEPHCPDIGLDMHLALSIESACNFDGDLSLLPADLEIDYYLMAVLIHATSGSISTEMLLPVRKPDPKCYQAVLKFEEEFLSFERSQNFQDMEGYINLVWTARLRELILRHRRVGYDWKFNSFQINMLDQYYNNNQLLIDCLNGGCLIDNELRHEIEETFLLPIAEIEKRKREKAE